MADVQHRAPLKRVAAIERWAERAVALKDSRKLDALIAAAFVVLTLMMCASVVANQISSNRTLNFNESATCAAPLQYFNNTSRNANRTMHRVAELLESKCHNASVTTAHQVSISGEPYPYLVVRLCEMGVTMINPSVVSYGEYSGKCEEMAANVTKIKIRRFPMVINHTGSLQLKLHSLGGACVAQHAIELAACSW